MIKLPLFFHPNSALFIDDNLEYVKNFADLESSSIKLEFLDNPLRFLEKVNFICEIDLQKYLYYPEEEVLENPLISLNLPLMHKEIFKEEPPIYYIAFIDYDMPMMNGLELCEKIKNRNIFKILLTGQADESIAIEAFNSKLIDGYIQKKDFKIFEKVEEYLQTFQDRYFIRMSEYYELLLKGKGNLLKILENDSFINIFKQFKKEKEIIEYYPYDLQGSFILKKNNNLFYLLNAYSEEEIEHIVIESDVFEKFEPYIRGKILSKSLLVDYKSPQNSNFSSLIDPEKFLVEPFMTISESKKTFYTIKEYNF